MSTRSQDVAARITQAILSRRLTPGTKLGEREVGDLFGVSRIVVRQALIRLAEGGLVTIERNRGAFVAKPSLQDAIEIHEALTLLEGGIFTALCDHIVPAGLAELTSHVARQRKAIEEGNDSLADHLGSEFHTLFVKLSGNRVIDEMHGQLTRRVRLLQALHMPSFDYCRLCEDHARIVHLIERRQVRRAQELLDEHYRLLLRGYRVAEAQPKPLPLEQALLASPAALAEGAASPGAGNPGGRERTGGGGNDSASSRAGRPRPRLVPLDRTEPS